MHKKVKIIPEEPKGYLFIAGEKVKIGKVGAGEEKSSAQLKKAVERLSKEKPFPLPEHLING